jgi:hypothetical protein
MVWREILLVGQMTKFWLDVRYLEGQVLEINHKSTLEKDVGIDLS